MSIIPQFGSFCTAAEAYEFIIQASFTHIVQE